MQQKMNQPFQAISFDIQQAGKHMKASKKKYIWKFKLGDKLHQLICSTSHLTGKLKVMMDGRILLQGQLIMGQPFEHSMMVNDHLLTIQKGQKQTKFRLAVNNKDFINQLSTSKGNQVFKTEETEVEDVLLTQNFGLDPNKKIKLNIAAMGDGMKKKKNVVQSENWKQINKEDISYFQGNNQDVRQDQKDSDEQPQNNNLSDLKIQHISNTHNHTHEQFSTLQILFGTTTNIQNLKNEEPTKKQSALDLLTNNFNTMQNLFSTQSPQNVTIPSISTNVNQNAQFTTMQALFATKNPNTQAVMTKNTDNLNQENFKTQGHSNDFNTIQNLFNTNVQGLPKIPTKDQNPSNPSYPLQQKNILQQFNTMQNLFATGALPPEFLNPKNFGTIQGIIKAPQTTNIPINLDPLNYQNFSTMQNLFATNQLNFPPPPISTIPTVTSVPPSADFMSVLKQPDGTSSNMLPVNSNEFNTMQELFKTGKLDLNSNPL